MSHALFVYSFYVYVVAFSDYVIELVSSKKVWRILGPVALGLGLLLQGGALLSRWVHAGQIELKAMQDAVGHPLTGVDWWMTAVGHPPYTNFYESLTFLSFMVLFIYFLSERKWKLPTLGCVAVGIGLLLLGRALLVPNPEIEPLVPALKSYWILIHVWNLFIAYACFLVACGFGMAFLYKVETPSTEIGAFLTALAGPVVVLAGGVRSLFGHLAFQMCPVGLNAGGHLAPLHYMKPGADKAQRLFADVPGVGPFLLAAAALYVVSAVLYFRAVRRHEGEPGAKGAAYWTTAAATAVLALGVVTIFWHTLAGGTVALPAVTGQLEQDLQGPYRFALAGNPDAVGLLLLTLACSGVFLALTRFRGALKVDLPEAKKLDDIIYRVITVGFPFLSVGIVMGAVWAHYSWGRYWGWDPKETWALITWFVYAVYLHTRITLGWTGKPGAFIAVAGFAVVIFCYMGVNLGLTGEGLHSYGAG
ncbi:MAG TPA: cytochrome c biogenesis protein CcsA [Myxococcales bacterium]|nr:cytochrome c biogenesis protein CcsA [Myxococcales bacterium]